MSTVTLLCGLPCSGKTTWAKEQEKDGVIRMTLDEEVFKRYGRYTDDYHEHERVTKEALRAEMKHAIWQRKSVILDFGFWKKADRDAWKEFIVESGGSWRLVYFKVSNDQLRTCLLKRNEQDPENNHVIDDKLLNAFIAQFEEPVGEGEEIYVHP